MSARYLSGLATVTLMSVLTGCTRGDADPPVGQPAVSAPVMSAAAADTWLGRWHGPEGTFVELAGGHGSYEVTIRNLDGPRTFNGKAVGSTVKFERDGAMEVLRASDGAATGMKWLAGKSDCLTVRAGEGYCRD